MAVDDVMRERIVVTNLLQAALYGVESIRVAGSALNGLRSAIADAIGPRSERKQHFSLTAFSYPIVTEWRGGRRDAILPLTTVVEVLSCKHQLHV